MKKRLLVSAITIAMLLADGTQGQTLPSGLKISHLPEAFTHPYSGKYEALDIRVGGRGVESWDKPTGNPELRYIYQWPGVYFTAAFTGREVYFYAQHSGRLRLTIDDLSVATLEPTSEAEYHVTGLTQGKHTIRVDDISEHQHDPDYFWGFTVPSKGYANLPAPPARSRQIEFIGDSFANGYAVTSTKHDCTDAEVAASSDSTQAWTTLSAKHADADYQINAYSGIGLMRNYDGTTEPIMTGLYPYTLFDKSVKYDDHDWHPQLIVIALGENDFSPPWPGQNPQKSGPWATADVLRPDFVATFVTFVQDLRARNPNARILLLDYGTPEVVADLKMVAGALGAQGVTGVETFHGGENFAVTGCNWHLDVNDHKRIATALDAWIDTHPEIWAH